MAWLRKQYLRGAISPSQSGGAWAATEVALRSQYAAASSQPTPHSQPAMASPPTVATTSGSTPPTSGLTQGVRYDAGAAALTYLGGKPKTFSTNYAGFPVATIAATGGNLSDGEQGVSWRMPVRVTAASVAFRVLGSAVPYRFIVDGQYVSKTGTMTTTSSGSNFIELQFGVSATREIIVEGEEAQRFYGVYVAPADVVALATGLEPGIVLYLGDSFTESAGATREGDGYAVWCSELLGFDNNWLSGVGSTGYLATMSGTRYKLSERIVADIQRAKDRGNVTKVFVAMGLNDLSIGDVATEANSCFSIIRSMLPDASVSVLSPWDVNAPSAPAAGFAARKAEIQSALVGRGGFRLLDFEGVSFTKFDAVHPNNSGHETLGTLLATKERTALG